jgi:hypothetical protein
MELGGWSNYEMVLRYAHLAPDHLAHHAEMVKLWAQLPKIRFRSRRHGSIGLRALPEKAVSECNTETGSGKDDGSPDEESGFAPAGS